MINRGRSETSLEGKNNKIINNTVRIKIKIIKFIFIVY